jgi:hypothetical protein
VEIEFPLQSATEARTAVSVASFPFLARLHRTISRTERIVTLTAETAPAYGPNWGREMTSHRDKRQDAMNPDPQAPNPDVSHESILDVYNLFVAIFLFVAPWLFAYANGAARLDFWASSALIAAMSITAIVAFSDWEEWLVLLLGIWLVSAPWILGYAHTRAMHMSLGIGAMVAYLAGLRLWLAHYRDAVAQ